MLQLPTVDSTVLYRITPELAVHNMTITAKRKTETTKSMTGKNIISKKITYNIITNTKKSATT